LPSSDENDLRDVASHINTRLETARAARQRTFHDS